VKSSKDFKKIGGLTSLLDLVDAAIFDFLIDNGDRHHFEVIDNKSRPTLLLLDNGKR
jgi:glycosaminoglycan xylosylkinase